MDKYQPYIDSILWSEDEADKEMDKLKVQYGLTIEEIQGILALLWYKMGSDITLHNALRNGLNSSRHKINKIVDQFYKEIVLPDTNLYRSGIYTGGYERALAHFPVGTNGRGLPFKDSNWVQQQIDIRWSPDGQLFKDRVWGNHRPQLKASLDTTVREAIISGKDLKKVSKQIAENMGVSYKKVERVVRTETNFIMNQSELDVLTHIGVEKYEYVAKLDHRTSSVCRGLDGKIFLTSQAIAGINLPPLHPNCRSTIMPVDGTDEDEET